MGECNLYFGTQTHTVRIIMVQRCISVENYVIIHDFKSLFSEPVICQIFDMALGSQY